MGSLPAPVRVLTLAGLAFSLMIASGVRAAAKQEPAAPAAQEPQVFGQQQPGQAAPQLTPSIYIMTVPGVQNCPAPDWIKPGTRLTFLSASATVASNPNDPLLVEDPNGTIVEYETGKRYRETGYVAGSAGGAGYTVIDIVAVEPNGIVMETSSYLLVNGTTGPAMLTSTVGSACHPSGCDFFLHPRMLAQVPGTNGRSVSVMKHSYEFNNQTFNAMRFSVQGQGRNTQVYDLASGVMLSSNHSTVAPTGTAATGGGTIVMTLGNTMAINRFISSRDMNMPWQNGRMPDWVRSAKKLRYTGATVTKSPPSIQTPDFRVGMTVELETTYVGGNCSVYKTTTVKQQVTDFPIGNDPVTGVLTCGPGSASGVWIDPAILRTLRTGQQIGSDATLGSQTFIEYAGQGQNAGQSIVVLTNKSPAGTTRFTYDAADGKLLAMVRVDSPNEAGFVTSVELQLAGIQQANE